MSDSRSSSLLPSPVLAAAAWTAGILIACSIPGSSLPDTALLSYDKVAHFVLFAGLGWLWMRALRIPLLRRAAVVLACGLAYAVLSEVYQGLLPFERAPDVYDALADSAGVATAVLLYVLVRRRSVEASAR